VKVLKSKITGLNIKHQGIAQLSAFIANQTHPPVSVRATIIQEESHNVDAIEFPKFSRLVATSDGLLKQRRSIYRQLGQSADYIRQVGFDRIQQKQMVIQYIQKHGRIKRKDVMDLCRLSRDQAGRLLQHMLAEEKLIANGQSRGTYYTIL
jgi:predicted HTH transcriptional regulator